jgi:hypothetical protein
LEYVHSDELVRDAVVGLAELNVAVDVNSSPPLKREDVGLCRQRPEGWTVEFVIELTA